MGDKEKSAAEYCVLNAAPEHRLSHFERLTLLGGRELERALGWVARQFHSFSLDSHVGAIDIAAMREAAKFYGDPRWSQQSRPFFAPAQPPAAVEVVPVHGLAGGEVLDLHFQSGYRFQYPHSEQLAEQHPKNQTVHVRMWRHHQRGRPVVVAIHGWTMGDQRINSLAFLPGAFYRHGLDVAIIELPYHGRRAGNDARSLFPSSDVVSTNESIGQAISDLRALKLWLEREGACDVGWIGVSLGAYVGALWSTLDRLAFAIAMVPLSNMAEAAWDYLSHQESFESLVASGLSRELMDSIYGLHSPLAAPGLLAPERSLILAGIGDHIVSARQAQQLHEHWGKPVLQWHDGGHGGFTHSTAFEEVEAFLRRNKLSQTDAASGLSEG